MKKISVKVEDTKTPITKKEQQFIIKKIVEIKNQLGFAINVEFV